jgi:phosphatidylcholine synthase
MPAKILGAIAVHIFTATGAICGLMALHHAAAHDWSQSFLWLGAAALIDAIDGPIARKIDVQKILPRFSGARLDLVVDYFNYCGVPAFIVMESGMAGQGNGIWAGSFILLSSLFHFADLDSKTEDGYFVGFPTPWNVVCLYIFVFQAGAVAALSIIFVLAAATFIPVKWVHPVRVRRLRGVTLMITAIWAASALYEVSQNFPGTFAVQAIFVLTAIYIAVIGLARTLQWGDAGS